MTDPQLRALVAVAETGRFTAAAKRLGVSQSGVSHAVAALERDLGVPLLRRSADGAEPTAFGERAVTLARRSLHLRDLIRQEAGAVRGLTGGVIRVGSFGVSASRRLLPPLLRAFADLYPDVEVRVVEGRDEEVLAWVHADRVDVGVVVTPAEGLDTVPLGEDEFVAVLPADHALARGGAVAPEGLVGTPYIRSGAGCDPAFPGVAVRHEIQDCATIVAMVREGLGVSVLPQLGLPDPLPEGVVTRPMAPRMPRRIALAARDRTDLLPGAAALYRLAANPRAYRGPGL